MNITAVNKKANTILAKYEGFYENDITLLLHAKKGLKPRAVFDFMEIAGMPNNYIETMLGKTIKTFNNYKENTTVLDAVISEKLLKLFSLYHKGLEVFGVLDEFKEWLQKPAYGLGEKIPDTLLDTITGIDIVMEELTAIAYGDLT